MFSARGVALNVATASVQLRMLQNSVYLPRGQSYQQLTVHVVFPQDPMLLNYKSTDHNFFLQRNFTLSVWCHLCATVTILIGCH
jgi:hypothetical protein